jgi:hypothetical protein
LLPEAIKSLNRQRGDLRFMIHGTVEETDYPQGRRCTALVLPRPQRDGANRRAFDGRLFLATQADIIRPLRSLRL